MTKIEVERIPAFQMGRPDSIIVKLIDSQGEIKATVCIYPRFEKPPFTDMFKVEILKGNHISPEVDISLIL